MNAEVWRRIEAALGDALEMETGEGLAYLRKELGHDEEGLTEALRLAGGATVAERMFAKGPVAGLGGMEAGARLGPWELVKPLGSGGMGVVWLAERVEGEVTMRAAIKMLPPALSGPLCGDEELRRRFLMEKQILARLQHPNIARLLDVGVGAGETPNFLMEYVEGVPLVEYAARKGVDRLGLFLKICEAVQYAHANLVLHRDLKPQNVLVSEAGEPKLLDFGIGKILNDPAGDASVTLRRAFSLDYASPEQIRGGMISTSTDIYSLGLVLYEMMSGERARRWNDKALGEVLEEAGRFVLPERAGLGADLMAVMRKATEADEQRRYRTVSDLAGDVERVRQGLPVEARGAGWLYQAGCFARRNWLAVGMSMVTLVVIVGLAVFGWMEARRAEGKSRELEVVLVAEKEARRGVEAQSKLARELGELASSREQQTEKQLKELLRVFGSVVAAARWDVSPMLGGRTVGIKLLEGILRQIEAMDPTEKTQANFMALQADAHGQLAEMYAELNGKVQEKEREKRHREQSLALWTELNRRFAENRDWARRMEEQRFKLALETLPKGLQGTSPEWAAVEQRLLRLREPGRKDPALLRTIGTYYFFRSVNTVAANQAKAKDMEAALRCYEEAGGVADPQTMRNQALAHKYLAGMLKGMERLPHAREALRLDRERVGLYPADASAKLDLGFSIVAVADVLYAEGQLSEARKGYWEGYELRKGLANLDLSNALAWRSLAYPIRLYGLTSYRLGDKEGLRRAAEEMAWYQESPKAAVVPIDRVSVLFWRGVGAEKREEGCRYLLEAAGVLEGLGQTEWLHKREELAERVNGCRAATGQTRGF